MIVQTSDWVPVCDGLRVWALPGREPATVDLETPVVGPWPGVWLLLHLDRGRREIVAPTTLATRHPHTGEPPPRLGDCRWIGACTAAAVRMAPHPLTSPVAICRTCARDTLP